MAHKKTDQIRIAVKSDMDGRAIKKKEKMTQHNFRMDENDYRKLEEHFADLGLSIGAGLRMALKTYMKENRI